MLQLSAYIIEKCIHFKEKCYTETVKHERKEQ